MELTAQEPQTTASAPLDSPRVSLLEKDLTQMSELELQEFVKMCRARYTSQAIALENKPERKSAKGVKEPSAVVKAKADLMKDLLT